METKIEKINVKNITFPVKMQDGNMMVNLSKMATPFKKRPIDWLRSKSAKIYTRCLSGVKNPTVADSWTVVKYGTVDERGTWVHDRLAVYFAEWLNSEFSLQVEQALKNLKVSNNDVPDTERRGVGTTDPLGGTQVATFVNESGQTIRVEMIDGEPWFVAKDVCDVLDIEKYRDAIARLDDDEKGCPLLMDTPGGKQQLSAVNESGLYNLIFQSRKPEAKIFRKWVTSEVLPTIRRTGRYSISRKDSQNIPDLGKHLSNIMYDVCFIEDINLRTRIAEQLKNLAL